VKLGIINICCNSNTRLLFTRKAQR